MATQLEVFRIVAPEFSGELDATVQAFLDLAPLYINPEIYPVESRGLALVLKAASLMYQRKRSASGSSSGGAILEEKEGDLMRKYGATGKNGETLDIYEQQLRELSAGTVAGMGILTRVY